MGPEQLYLLPPEEFTAARDEAGKAAKAAGHADVATDLKALRRPSVAAWLVNRLAHEQPDLVDQLLQLGPALASAQAQGQGDELRALGAQRRALVDAVVSRAVDLADRPVSAAVRDEVASTLEAGLSDPGAADAVRSGRLVRALSYAGFGGVDLDGAVAAAAARASVTARKVKAEKPTRNKSAEREERIAAAETAALAAAGRLDDAVRLCEQAQRDQAAAQGDADAAHAQVEQLRAHLAEAEASAAQADSRRRKADKAADAAVETVRRRPDAEERARTELDRLRREKA